MLSLNVLVFCALVVRWCSAYNIDIDTTNGMLWNGKVGTYFGFSVALHGRINDENTVLVGAPFANIYGNDKVEGDVYKCSVKKKDICEAGVLQDDSEEDSGTHPKQMFGASIYTAGRFKPVVICAPRYTEKHDVVERYFLFGKCTWYNSQVNKRKNIIPCKDKKTTYYGFCQAGFDVKYYDNEKTLLMGAVGTRKGTGAVIKQDNFPLGKEFIFTPLDQAIVSDYLGFSVTNGNFFSNDTNDQYVVGGKPRAGLSGQVFIYDKSNKLSDVVNPPKKVVSEKFFIYFGASVCAVDLNGDGYSDLLIGAPFYSDKGDEGRVYVYISRENSGKRSLTLEPRDNNDAGLRGNNREGARFGWIIVRAGDLNDDGYEDVIIGAPHDQPDLDGDGLGDGAIYIYHGSRSGKMYDPQQVITAEDMQKRFGVSLKQFGYAVAGNMDTDDNEYPDIAIGSWKSDKVVLLRTRPVMDIKASLTLSKTEIPIEGNITNCKDGVIDRQCLNATACFRYLGKGVDGVQVLEYTFTLDETAKAQRVYLKDVNGNKEYERKGSVTLQMKDNDTCIYFNNIFVQDKNELQNNLATGNDIQFLIQYKLQLKSECDTSKLCPILDQSQTPLIRKKATLINNCSDNTCDYNLFVKLSADPKNITIGKTEKVIVVITLGNKEEKSYNPEITITHDDSLQYEKFVVVTKDVRIERRTLSSGNQSTAEQFRLQGVLESGQTVVFRLQYSSKEVKGTKNQLEVVVSTEATSGQESNKTDNKDSVFFRVQREVKLSIDTTSVPKAISYPITSEAVGSSNGSVVDYSTVNGSSVGKLVKTTFVLNNDGESDLQSLTFQISFPFREREPNNQQKYIVYPAAITFPLSYGKCDKSKINPESLMNVELESRKKRGIEILTPRNRPSATIECQVYKLTTTDPFTVELSIRVWVNTVVKYHPDDLVLQFSARATYKDPLRDNKETTVGPKSLDIVVTAENAAAEQKTTPIWVIIVAVLGGVLFLAIVIFALFKFGFFKRNRPPKDISSPQTEDGPGVAGTTE